MTPATLSAAVASAPSLDRLWVDRHVPESEWNRFVQRHPDATCDHLWGWREVFRRVFGQESVYLAARRGPEIVGLLPLVQFRSRLFGRSVISLPYLNYGGLLAGDPEAANLLISEAREIGRAFKASYVELRHRRRHASMLPVRQHKVGMQLPIPATAEALWNSIDRKVRNQVRKAQKESLVMQTGGRELVDDFYGVFAINMRDLGTPVYSRRLFESTLELFADQARVHVVRKGALPIAASVTLRFRDTILVPWASSLREYRQLCPNMLLYWGMLEHTVQTGANCFDFGRSSRGGGTHHFKQQWGAVETPLHWEYLLLSRSQAPGDGKESDSFSTAIALWQRMPLWLANIAGPPIVANIP
jgi:serine/alanine adding enzyme